MPPEYDKNAFLKTMNEHEIVKAIMKKNKDDHTNQPAQKKHCEKAELLLGPSALPPGYFGGPADKVVDNEGFYDKVEKAVSKKPAKKKGVEKKPKKSAMSEVEFYCRVLKEVLEAASYLVLDDIIALPEYQDKAAEMYQGPAAGKALRKDLLCFLNDLPQAAQIVHDAPPPNAWAIYHAPEIVQTPVVLPEIST